MKPCGRTRRRTAVAILAAALALGAVALPAEGASHDPVAGASKRCKRKRPHHKRRRCKRRQAKAALSISPPGHDFGDIGSGDSPPFDFVVTNTGGATSGIPAASISGPQATNYRINSTTCTAPLAPAATCAVTVQSVDNVGGIASGKLNVTAAPGGAASADLLVNFV